MEDLKDVLGTDHYQVLHDRAILRIWTLACYALALSVLVLAFINFHQIQIGMQPKTTEISDTQLLYDLEDHMTEDVPDALQPADLLVSEMSDTEDQGTKIIHNEGLRKSK